MRPARRRLQEDVLNAGLDLTQIGRNLVGDPLRVGDRELGRLDRLPYLRSRGLTEEQILGMGADGHGDTCEQHADCDRGGGVVALVTRVVPGEPVATPAAVFATASTTLAASA